MNDYGAITNRLYRTFGTLYIGYLTLDILRLRIFMARETYLPDLFQLFRQYGYDGVSLAKIAEATSLGKASLYHHFPGGKAEMVSATLAYGEGWMEANIVQVLRDEGTALERFHRMCDLLNKLYAGGHQPCLLAALITGGARDRVHEQVKAQLHQWISAIATVLTEAGLAPELAQQRGEDAVMTIQGALILSRGLDNPILFQSAIAGLPEALCHNL